MNANISQENIIADKTVIIKENVKDKISGQKVIYKFRTKCLNINKEILKLVKGVA